MRLRELTIRYAPATVPIERPQATTPAEAARILLPLLDTEPTEVFGVLLLNTKRRVLAWHPVSRGSLNATIIEPREVFRAAIVANAAAIIAALACRQPEVQKVVIVEPLEALGHAPL